MSDQRTSKTLVERLRELAENEHRAARVCERHDVELSSVPYAHAMSAAADEIERLERDVELYRNNALLLDRLRRADETTAKCIHLRVDKKGRCEDCGMQGWAIPDDLVPAVKTDDGDDIGPAPPYIAGPAAEAIARSLDAEIMRDADMSAAAICNRRAEKDLEGYHRAFAVRDRLKAAEAAEKTDERRCECKEPTPAYFNRNWCRGCGYALR